MTVPCWGHSFKCRHRVSHRMLILAFPAPEGSSCCLGSGDWPVDPHEVLFHPLDLEKLRVPAFGYVAIHRKSSKSYGRGSGHDHRPRSNEGRKGSALEDSTAATRAPDDAPHEDKPVAFCRAVPDDSLAPGETRAPAWLLSAAGVWPRQHLLVYRAPVVPAADGVTAPAAAASAAGRQHRPLYRSRLHLSHVLRSSKDPARNLHPAAASTRMSNNGRAIGRRVSGCMVQVGTLLAAEVLGETVVLKVASISSAIESDCDGIDADADLYTGRPLIITPSDEIILLGADHAVCDGGSLIPRSGASSSPNMSPEGPETRRRLHRRPQEKEQRQQLGKPAARCAGRGNAWAGQAPGLESALAELHALVLLCVGGDGGDGGGGGPRRLPWMDVLPAGIILCGPSGVGKTFALDILVEDLRKAHGVHVIRLLGPQILAGSAQHGGTGATAWAAASPLLRGPLGRFLAEARARAPSVLVFDELDALFDALGGISGDEVGGGVGADPLSEGARANAALLEMLDRASAIDGVAVLGATRRSPDGKDGAEWAGLEQGDGGCGGDGAALPAAFRKPGRFDRCVMLGPPTQAQREGILRVLLSPSSSSLSSLDGACEWELEPLGTTRSPVAADFSVDRGPSQEAHPVCSSGGGMESDPGEPSSRSPDVGGRGCDEEQSKGRRQRVGASGGGGEAERRRSSGESTGSAEAGGRSRLPEEEDTFETGAAVAADDILAEWAKRLSTVTPGMVGGDLERLVRTARARSAQRRRSAVLSEGGLLLPTQSSQPNVLAWQDTLGAVAVTVPRSLRGLDVTSAFSNRDGGGVGGGAPSWNSVGGFSEAKRRLQRLVQWPWLHPEAFARMGVSAPAGALLYGPSGCGKSLVAQVLASECLANFLWVRSSELLSRYLGETEAKLRALFSRARAAAPCILFLDELDAITAKRGDGDGGREGSGGAGSVHARVLSTLLNEMDGVASAPAAPAAQTLALYSSSLSAGGPAMAAAAAGGRRPRTGAGGGVLVLAATNRREALDAALLRPGRLHESVELGVPGREDREGVLRVHARRLPLAAGVDLVRLSQDDLSGGLTCADLEASCRDAAMMALREDLQGANEVRPEHLRRALEDRVAGRLRTRSFTFSIGQ